MAQKIYIMLLCSIVIVLIANGFRQTFGIFLLPVAADLDISRQAFGLVVAIQALLFGFVQPIAGLIADRHGSFKVIVGGAFLYALGLWLMSISANAIDLHISLSFLIGLGLAGTTQVIVLGAMGRAVPNERRGFVFGTVIASGSFGMFLFVPSLQGMMGIFGWRETLIIMASLVLLIPLLALGLRINTTTNNVGKIQSLREAVGEARCHRGYILLEAGFFVCGFHVTFISTHFPAYLADKGVSLSAAAYALGIIGLFNILGAYVFGTAGDRYRKKNLLTFIYSSRALVMILMLILPITDNTALIFGAILGVLWLATVPLTSGIVAQIFGTQYFSMLYGIVFMSHQFGAFSGAWLGGYIYEIAGSYDLMWVVSAALGLAAAALHWPINDKPLDRIASQSS